MGDWFFKLSVPWMALVIFLATYLIAGIVDLVVTRLAVNERAKGFKAVSPECYPYWAPFSPCWSASSPSMSGAISPRQRLQCRLRPVRFVPSFYSPELFPTNGGAFMR